MSGQVRRWTNKSVLKFDPDADPVETVTKRAREIVIEAMDAGWSGPPFDPLGIADHLKLEVVARDDVRDARTVPVGRTKSRIEFNPNRPRDRMRYSIAHEIAHTMFPDCAERIRNRAAHGELSRDDWQLEALCNIAAAEFLMPMVSVGTLSVRDLSIDRLGAMRREYDVSAEALLIRAVRVIDDPCAMFCASPIELGAKRGSFRLDYLIGSQAWRGGPTRVVLPPNSVVAECTGIGYTAKGDAPMDFWGAAMHLECEGIPPYPGSHQPRVAGVLIPKEAGLAQSGIIYLKGSATEPRGGGNKIIVHVVNDRTPNWGGTGFAQQVQGKWPVAQSEFRTWSTGNSSRLSLGNVHFTEVGNLTTVASMVCQKGYGPSEKPRIRYLALKQALIHVAKIAKQKRATVHMPRIGCGQAGGLWDIVKEIIDATLGASEVPVFVYDLPNSTFHTLGPRSAIQGALDLPTTGLHRLGGTTVPA